MDIQKYFTQHKKNILTQEEKMVIYHDFLQKKSKKGLSFSVLSKYFTYGVMASFLFFVVFGLFQYQGLPYISYDDGDIVVIKDTSTNIQRVNANSIAQIVEFQGTYKIINEDKEYETNLIYNNDTILLGEGAYMTFMVGGHVANIQGPAKVRILEDQSDIYTVEIISGGFVEIISDETSQQDILSIQKDDLIISTQQDTSTNIQIVEENKQTVVKNYGDEIVISQTENEDASLLVSTNFGVTLEDNADWTNIEEESLDLSSKLLFLEEQVDQSEQQKIESALVLLGDTEEENTEQQEIITDKDLRQSQEQELSSPVTVESLIEEAITGADDVPVVLNTESISSNKKIPTPVELSMIQNKLNDAAIYNRIYSLVEASQQGVAEYNQEKDSILAELYPVFAIVDVPTTNISLMLDGLRVALINNWYLPQQYITNVGYLNTWIKKLDGTNPLILDEGETIESYINNN